VITAVHNLIYSDDPEATRAFLRDVLGWPFVEDPGSVPSWLIFRTGPSETGVHPTSGDGGESGEAYTMDKHHEVTLLCDDIETTVAELRTKGAEFSDTVTDMGFGLGIYLVLPGAGQILLYEPRHPTAYGLSPAATATFDMGAPASPVDHALRFAADLEDQGSIRKAAISE